MLGDKFEETIINHIFREGKRGVDKLANKGVDGEDVLMK